VESGREGYRIIWEMRKLAIASSAEMKNSHPKPAFPITQMPNKGASAIASVVDRP